MVSTAATRLLLDFTVASLVPPVAEKAVVQVGTLVVADPYVA